MKTRHVWVLPPLDVGEPAQGLVVSWRKTERQASPPLWEGQVAYVDRAEVQRIEWIPVTYLRPVHSERPDA